MRPAYFDTSRLPGHIPYRADIDGLRAIAVLSVVLYHFGVPGLSGGFVGVDVFFVLSGFLIGGILWREYCETGGIEIVRFYVRRFKRLAPAFFAMALGTAVVAQIVLLPFEYKEFGKSLIAATVYLSNVLFYRSTGYFDIAADDKPLLHTWSLAVEEQFYIVLPLILIGLQRWVGLIVPLLVVLFFGSLAACVWLTLSHPTATFYLFPFRAWEMLAGVLLAIWAYRYDRPLKGGLIWHLLGLALILGSILTIRPDMPFPGAIAAAPVLGTVILLATGRGDSIVTRVLSSPVPVFFGLISYSLYLWHWPVLTLSTYLRGGYSGPVEALGWMILALALAYISYRLIERPVRTARRLPSFVVFGGVLVASCAALAFGGLIYLRDGQPERFGPAAQPHIAASADFLQDWSRCTVPASGPLAGLEVCPIGPEGPTRVLVWGDSHVRAFKEGIDLAAHEGGTSGLIIWRAGCPPLVGIRKIESAATPAEDRACYNATRQTLQSLGRMPELETVLLIGRWSYYAEGAGVGLDAGNTIRLVADGNSVDATRGQDAIFVDAVKETVSELKSRVPHVAVLRQVPEVAQYDSRRAAREAAHAGLPLAAKPVTQTDVPMNEVANRIRSSDEIFHRLAVAGHITELIPRQNLCDAESCHALIEGIGFYFDNNHITNTAARMLRGHFRVIFGQPEDGGGT